MTKDTRKMSDDEYQFPEEEYVTTEQHGSDQHTAEALHTDEVQSDDSHDGSASRFSAVTDMLKTVPVLKNKRVLAVIGVAVVALIGFKLMTGDKTHVVQKTPEKTQVQQPETVQSQASPQVLGQLSTVEQNAQKNQADIGQLQQSVQTVQSALASSAQTQSQTNQEMSALVNQVKQLTAEVKKMQQPTKKKVKKGPVAPKIVYQLKAVIPGRAWIISNRGISTTVAVGDKIPQYGRVVAVQPQKGDVLTSSGKIIAYGPYDA